MNNDTLAKALFELLGEQQATIAKLLEQIDPTPPQETTSYAWLWWMFLFVGLFVSVVLCVVRGFDCKVHQKIAHPQCTCREFYKEEFEKDIDGVLHEVDV
jgi:hypothetical protein